MHHGKSLDPKRIQPVIRSGGGRSHAKIEDLSLEELCERINIQSNILDLRSKDKERVKSALNTLSLIAKITDRKDVLYVLVGYYMTEVRTIDEMVNFFHGTRAASTIDLYMMILKDLVKIKDISRQRLFVNDFLSDLAMFFRESDDDRKNEIRMLIENSAWGDKLKRKFIDTLFYRESRL
jgi:hypothetical protein